ncbi:MAG: SDR family oxidoreductase [Chloroflexota bacterium]
MINPNLSNKVALITGGNNPHGIGANAARAFAAQGAKIFIHYYRRNIEELATEKIPASQAGEKFYWEQQHHMAEEIVAEIEGNGGQAAAFEADLSDATVIGQIFDQAESTLGPVDILINNAAASDPDTFVPDSELDENSRAVDAFPMISFRADHHDFIFATNCRATALMMAEYTKRHVTRNADWGRIINISTDGASGFATQVSYGASKHAIESYSRAAAIELGKYGITVNIASLGPIQTGWITPEMDKDISANTPLGRIGQPEDVADVLIFLASEQARWVTGQLIYVGGGFQMGL